VQRVFDVVELERLDDGLDLLHLSLAPLVLPVLAMPPAWL
jgi:hypothetical protein